MKYLIALEPRIESFDILEITKELLKDDDQIFVLTVIEKYTNIECWQSENKELELNLKLLQNSEIYVSEYARILEKPNVQITCIIAEGEVKKVICKTAKELKVDMVILGRRNMSKIQRSLSNSTSSYCSHHLPCSLLINPINWF